MGDNTTEPEKSTIPILRTNNRREEEEFVECRKSERSCLLKIVKFLKKTNDLESNIYNLEMYILEFEPVQRATPFEVIDIREVIY